MSTERLRIRRLERPAKGSSQPWFCQLEDKSSWLVKFAGAGPGTDALLAEYMANGLAQLWGLPVPEAKPVLLDASVERAGTDEFWDVLRASEGWNLAIRTIADAENVDLSEHLPKETLAGLLRFDTVLLNWDRTTLSRNLMRDSAGTLWWIDHGSCRFLHALAKREPAFLPATHFLSERQDGLVPPSLPAIETSQLETLIAGAPAEWMRSSPLQAEEIASYLRHALR